MSASWNETRTSLDNSLAILAETLEKLQAAQPVDVHQIIDKLTIAAESARDLRSYVSFELPQASWTTRPELDGLLRNIEELERSRGVERSRSRILALADELGRGRVIHRRASRADQLNLLRSEAMEGLRMRAAKPIPDDLPGPEPERWIGWACGLKEPDDAETLQTLCTSFPQLFEFVVNIDTSMWEGGAPSGESKPGVAKKTPSDVNSTNEGSSANADIDLPVPTFGMSDQSWAKAGLPEDAAEQSDKRSLPVRTIGIAGAAVLVLAIIGAIAWGTHRSANNTPVQANERKVETSPVVPASGPLTHQEPAEGPQDKILLTVESCKRKDARIIECWGYANNQRLDVSEVALSHSDVIDGKGNTFNLNSNGQFDFETGRSANIAGGSNAKYTLKIPDTDQAAKSLTLYLDVSKPRGLEYTFRDVPVSQ